METKKTIHKELTDEKIHSLALSYGLHEEWNIPKKGNVTMILSGSEANINRLKNEFPEVEKYAKLEVR